MTVFGIRLGVLGRFYRWRLREHGVQELLAAAGIAVGVALVFGVLVANTSLSTSIERLVDGVVGSARIQLAGRSTDGFDQRIADAAAHLPGIKHAAPDLRANVAVIGPNGVRRSIQLVGVTPALAALGGVQTRDFGPGGLRLSTGITLPSGVADAVGVHAGETVHLLAGGRSRRVRVGTVLGSGTIGSLADSPVGIALLGVTQRLVGREGRVSQLLVEPEPGADAMVAAQLRRIADGRLYVGPADAELRQLALTAKPNDQSTTLFAAIGAMVGFLLALNAMLMTVPARRRFVAELRTQGFDRGQVLLILGVEALILGAAASSVGLVLGDVLSETLFNRVPAYLAFAFPIGTHRVVDLSTLLLAFGGGVLAALLATLPPVFDLRRGRAIDAVFVEVGTAEGGERIAARTMHGLLLVAVAIIAGATLLAAIEPEFAVVSELLLAVATLCLIPFAFAAVTKPLARVSRRMHGSMLAVAVMETRATTMRSIALAAVGAIAVFGSVAIEGARHDLVRGLDANFGEYLSSADLWVTTGGDDLTTDSFRARGLPAAIARTSGVTAVRSYYGGLLDAGDRRLWIVARSPADRLMIPPSQITDGDLATATARIRKGPWAAVSDVFAKSRHLSIGDAFTLPTPSGATRLRVAAVTTNLGWPPGGVIINADVYRHAWLTSDPTALQVEVSSAASLPAVAHSVERLLGAQSGLAVQTQSERRAQYAALSRQGLTSLSQISALLLVAAAVAIASALGAAIWERRPRLAALKIQGFDHRQLWRALLIEGTIVLGVGCTLGAVIGLLGHALANRYLETTTGFPAPFSMAGDSLLVTLSLVVGIAIAIYLLPGWLAAKVQPRASFQE